MISLLGVISALIILLSGIIITIFSIAPEGEEELGFVEGIWVSMMRTLDAGTMGGDAGWEFRIIAFFVTIGGIFVISALIGVLNNAIEAKLTELRKGKSFVIEKNHTLILGWSSKVFTILSELAEANENQKKSRVVILADRDKVEMEDEIKAALPKTGKMKIICRSGNPNDLNAIELVNPQESKSIIILLDDQKKTDSMVIKTILALTNNPNRRTAPYHITAEINDMKNIEVVKMIGKDEVELVLSDDIIARIMIQTSRQSGLSMVYQELMDFDGAEIYFAEVPLVNGKTYGESLFYFDHSAVIGIYEKKTSKVLINPPMDYIIQPGDQIIAITEDDDTLIPNNKLIYSVNEPIITNKTTTEKKAEKTLILGWNSRTPRLLNEIEQYVAPGSTVKIVSVHPVDSLEKLLLESEFKNIQVEFHHADTTNSKVIRALNVSEYDNILVLCYREEYEIQEADSMTLITLLHLRQIMEETGTSLKVVSEMLDVNNRDLAEVTKADDFIVSDKLISLLMSQVSENKQLMRVFEDLMQSDGSEIYLKPVSEYVIPGVETDFYTILESARRKGDSAIGYRLKSKSHDSSASYGVVVNPDKSKKVYFNEGDKIIVLSEEG